MAFDISITRYQGYHKYVLLRRIDVNMFIKIIHIDIAYVNKSSISIPYTCTRFHTCMCKGFCVAGYRINVPDTGCGVGLGLHCSISRLYSLICMLYVVWTLFILFINRITNYHHRHAMVMRTVSASICLHGTFLSTDIIFEPCTCFILYVESTIMVHG